MEHFRPAVSLGHFVFQYVSLAILCVCAGAFFATTALASLGVLPWLELPVLLDGVPVEHAGAYLQIAVTALLACLCFLIPTQQRVLKLEHAHHAFSIRMEDVAQAYAIANADDRSGVFQATSEFDAVKERISHLRNHPDLGSLEPDILEVAAQMSRISQDLADAFSDERVDRARDFLVQRQQEVAQFQERLDHAKALHSDIRQWANRIELDEAVARSQLSAIREELDELMPELGLSDRPVKRKDGVIRMPNVAKH